MLPSNLLCIHFLRCLALVLKPLPFVHRFASGPPAADRRFCAAAPRSGCWFARRRIEAARRAGEMDVRPSGVSIGPCGSAGCADRPCSAGGGEELPWHAGWDLNLLPRDPFGVTIFSSSGTDGASQRRRDQHQSDFPAGGKHRQPFFPHFSPFLLNAAEPTQVDGNRRCRSGYAGAHIQTLWMLGRGPAQTRMRRPARPVTRRGDSDTDVN